MNRREFLKVSLAGLVGAVVGRLWPEKPAEMGIDWAKGESETVINVKSAKWDHPEGVDVIDTWLSDSGQMVYVCGSDYQYWLYHDWSRCWWQVEATPWLLLEHRESLRQRMEFFWEEANTALWNGPIFYAEALRLFRIWKKAGLLLSSLLLGSERVGNLLDKVG